MNIIGRLLGRYTGTRDDKMVVIGSHYDTNQTSPGVDDNGSGMTALLQALKLFTSPGNKIDFGNFNFFMFVKYTIKWVLKIRPRLFKGWTTLSTG